VAKGGVIFIPKPGRTSMERLVDQSIRMGPLKKIRLECSQHAYQSGRSSETALHDLVSRNESALGHKIFALGAFLDEGGAFDNTSFEAMGRDGSHAQ
jgi:hypothetical protein